MTAIGRGALANSIFVERLRVDAPFNDAEQVVFYGGTAGYADYPRLDD